MESEDADHGESSRAGKDDAARSGTSTEVTKKGKRRKLNPKK